MCSLCSNINSQAEFPCNSSKDSLDDSMTSIFQMIDTCSQQHFKALLRQQIDNSHLSVFWNDIILHIISTIPKFSKSFLKDTVLTNTLVNLYNQIVIDININYSTDKNYCVTGKIIESECNCTIEFKNLEYPKIMLIDFPISSSRISLYDYGISLFKSAQKNDYLVDKIISLNPDILISSKPMDDEFIQKFSNSGIITISDISLGMVKSLSKFIQCEIVSDRNSIQSDKIGTCGFLKINLIRDNFYSFIFSGFEDLFATSIFLNKKNASDWDKVQHILKMTLSFFEYIVFENCFLDDYGVLSAAVFPRVEIPEFDKDYLKVFYNNWYSLSPHVYVEPPILLKECNKAWESHVKLGVQYFNKVLNHEEYKAILKNKGVEYNEYIESSYLFRISEFLINESLENSKVRFEDYSYQWDLFKYSKPNLLRKSPLSEMCFVFYTFLNNSSHFCRKPEILSLQYYSSSNDLSIEDFVKQELKSINDICENCGNTSMNHAKSYVRNDSNIIITIRDNESTWFQEIHLWSKDHSGKCSSSRKLSNNSRLFSFAKFLDLVFSPHNGLHFKNRKGDLHPFKSSVLCFGLYDIIIEVKRLVLNVYQIEYCSNIKDSLISINNKNINYMNIRNKVEDTFKSIHERLWSIGFFHKRIFGGAIDIELKIRSLLNLVNSDKESCLNELSGIFTSTHITDGISLNIVIFSLQQYCVKWNKSINDLEMELNGIEEGKSLEEAIKKIPTFQLLTYLYMNSGGSSTKQDSKLINNTEISVQDYLPTETCSTIDDIECDISQNSDQKYNLPKLYDNNYMTENNSSEKYVSKVSMIPKLKVKTSSVKEKISQMEALISGKNIYSNSKSPSIKSPFSELSSHSLDKELLGNNVKVSELKTYFDDLQIKFKKQLEEQSKMERKLKNSRYALEVSKESDENMANRTDEDSDRDSSVFKNFSRSKEAKHIGEASNFTNFDDRSFDNAADETLFFDCDSLIGDKDFSENPVNIITEAYDNDSANISEKPKIIDNALKYNSDFYDKESVSDLFKKFITNKSIFFNPIESPLNFSEHILIGSNIILRDNEPSSFIAYSLLNKAYLAQLSGMKQNKSNYSSEDNFYLSYMLEPLIKDCNYKFEIKDNLNFSCKIYFVEQFEAFREKCGLAGFNFANSLSSCFQIEEHVWKTSDSEYILTEVTAVDFRSLCSVLSEYFHYFVDILFNGSPSCLSKILGMYEVSVRNHITGKQYKKYLVITKNLYQENCEEDIKLNSSSLEDSVNCSKVFPIYMRYRSFKILKTSLLNDLKFLESIGIFTFTLEIQKLDFLKIKFHISEFIADSITGAAIHNIVKDDIFYDSYDRNINTNNNKSDKLNTISFNERLINNLENCIVAVPDEWHI